MHEFSTMQGIVSAIREEGRKHNAKAITKVWLEIGELTFLGEEQLRFAFDVLTEGTEMEGAELIIQKVEPKSDANAGMRGRLTMMRRRSFISSFPY